VSGRFIPDIQFTVRSVGLVPEDAVEKREVSFLLLPEMESQFLGRPMRSLFTLPTELSLCYRIRSEQCYMSEHKLNSILKTNLLSLFFILSLFYQVSNCLQSFSPLFHSFPNAVSTVAFFHCKSHSKVIFFSIFTCRFESQLRIHEIARLRFLAADFFSVTVACGVILTSSQFILVSRCRLTVY